MNSPSLASLRDEVDAADRAIVELVARRMRAVDAIGALKRASALPLRDPAREAEMAARREGWARELGLDPGLVERLTRLLVEGAVARMSAGLAREQGGDEPSGPPAAPTPGGPGGDG